MMAPAAPAMPAPRPIARRASLLIDMPCRAAASRSCAQARNAQPRRVRLRKSQNAASSTTAIPKATRRCQGTATPSMPKSGAAPG